MRSQLRIATGLGVVLVAAGLVGCDRVAPPGQSAERKGLTGGTRIFADDFQRDDLGDHWTTTANAAWTLDHGVLQVANARNDALWLDVPLPDRVRVEFDVTGHHDDGDLKFEMFGDGHTHASGYILIYGGWQNTTTCIARLDEHGRDRLDREEHVPVEPGRTYHFAAVRTDNRLRFYIDGELVLTYDDAHPLEGEGHRHMAFNNWTAAASFDNLEIYDLTDE